MIAVVICSTVVASFFVFIILLPCAGHTSCAFTSFSFMLSWPVPSSISFIHLGFRLQWGKKALLARCLLILLMVRINMRLLLVWVYPHLYWPWCLLGTIYHRLLANPHALPHPYSTLLRYSAGRSFLFWNCPSFPLPSSSLVQATSRGRTIQSVTAEYMHFP
jgi:hypothetical protein